MPKANNKRKNGKVKKRKLPQLQTKLITKLPVEEQIKAIYGNKRPYCVDCGKDAVLADDKEVSHYKLYDTTYKLDFIFVPQCDCWQSNESWMDVR